MLHNANLIKTLTGEPNKALSDDSNIVYYYRPFFSKIACSFCISDTILGMSLICPTHGQ